MSTNVASVISPLLGNYIYIGGGTLTVVILILLALYLTRRI
jgi:hypothetical protein